MIRTGKLYRLAQHEFHCHVSRNLQIELPQGSANLVIQTQPLDHLPAECPHDLHQSRYVKTSARAYRTLVLRPSRSSCVTLKIACT